MGAEEGGGGGRWLGPMAGAVAEAGVGWGGDRGRCGLGAAQLGGGRGGKDGFGCAGHCGALARAGVGGDL